MEISRGKHWGFIWRLKEEGMAKTEIRQRCHQICPLLETKLHSFVVKIIILVTKRKECILMWNSRKRRRILRSLCCKVFACATFLPHPFFSPRGILSSATHKQPVVVGIGAGRRLIGCGKSPLLLSLSFLPQFSSGALPNRLAGI